MSLIPLQQMTPAGLAPTTQAATGGGDTIQLASWDDDRSFLQVTNGGGSSVTVTLTDPGTTRAGSAATSPTVTVAASATKLIPLSPALINTANGLIAVSCSPTTSVTVAGVRR